MLRKTITVLTLSALLSFALSANLASQAAGSGITLGGGQGAAETHRSNARIMIPFGSVFSGTRKSTWAMEINPPSHYRTKTYAICFAGLDAPGGVLFDSKIFPPIFWGFLPPVSNGEIDFNINSWRIPLPKMPKLYFQVYWSYDIGRTWQRSHSCWIEVK